MNYPQLDNIECTVQRYLPMKSTVDLETRVRGHSVIETKEPS